MGRGKKENLKPFNKLTVEEQRKIASMGGKKSVEVKNQKRLLKDTIKMMLALQPTPQMVNECAEKFGFNPEDLQDVITGGLITKAMAGDSKAFEVLRDTVGEKPIDIQEVTHKGSGLTIEVKP